MSVNSHGLSRNIPEAVKREVRQRCGFGCVGCGASIYEYEHFDPPFREAKVHLAKGIALLCPTCHALKSKGVLNWAWVAEKNGLPAAVAAGHSKISLPHFKDVPTLQLGGGILFQDVPMPFRIDDVPVISFKAPEAGSTVTRLSALIRGVNGETLLRIVDNEWIVEGGVWDFEWVGNRMTIRDSSTRPVFQLSIFPPHLISVDRMVTNINRHRIEVTETELSVDGSRIINCGVSNFPVGVQVGAMTPKAEKQSGGCGFYIH